MNIQKFEPFGVFLAGSIVTMIVLACFGTFSEKPQKEINSTTAEKKVEYTENSLVGASQITCTYPRILNAAYFEGSISHSLPADETNPMIFTFSDLNAETASVKYIGATRSIQEAPILKINSNPNELVFVEIGDSYITTHTIFKDKGVSLFSKEVDLFGIPSGSLAMGTCVGY